MSDSINIKRATKDFNSAPEYTEYSKVILHIDDDNAVVSGNDTGRTLEANCPFATQEIADNLLAKLKGFRYQPYSAGGALFDPSAELGDGVKIADIFGGIYSQDINFDSLCSADIEAPQDGDIDHEYPYQPKQDREVKRQFRKVGSEIKKTNDEILLRVTGEEAQSLIDQTVDKITLSVGGEGGKTVFELRKDGAVFSSETVDLKVKAVNIEGELSADKITSGTMRADRISGGALTLGGVNGELGVLQIKDKDNKIFLENRQNGALITKDVNTDLAEYWMSAYGFLGVFDTYNLGVFGPFWLGTQTSGDRGSMSAWGTFTLAKCTQDGGYDDAIRMNASDGSIVCKKLIVNGHEIT